MAFGCTKLTLDGIRQEAFLILNAAQEIKRTTEARAAETVDLNDALEESIKRVLASRPEAEERIQVIRNLAHDLPPLYVERNSLLDTFVSIIQNGIEAISKEGVLSLATCLGSVNDQPSIEVRISDTGVGIPPDDIPKVFDLFYTTKEQGLGFGLWRDRAFVRKLGGNIEVSSAIGVGTTFTLKFPVRSDALS